MRPRNRLCQSFGRRSPRSLRDDLRIGFASYSPERSTDHNSAVARCDFSLCAMVSHPPRNVCLTGRCDRRLISVDPTGKLDEGFRKRLHLLSYVGPQLTSASRPGRFPYRRQMVRQDLAVVDAEISRRATCLLKMNIDIR